MIFVLLNILFAVFLIWFTMKVDVKTDDGRIKPLINITLYTSVIALFNAISITVSFFNNVKIVSVLGTLTLLMGVLLSVNFALYCLMYPKYKTNFLTLLFQIVFIGLGVYILFFKLGSFGITRSAGMVIQGKALNLPITIVGMPPLTWMDVFYAVFIILLPFIGALTLLVKMIVGANVVYKQQTFFTLLSVLIVWASFGVLYWVSKTFDSFVMYDTLFTAGLVLMILMLYKSVTLGESFDVKTTLVSLGRFFYTFLFEAILAGLLFAVLLPLKAERPVNFVILYLLGVWVILLVGYT